MDIAKDIREFLMSRRAKVTPDQVGLNPGVRRRVPGLRREEAAQLAGVSTEYYTQIERGNVTGVSDDVLHAVSRALHCPTTKRFASSTSPAPQQAHAQFHARSAQQSRTFPTAFKH
jgi:transcriptional regulator with XRE-family HTH domain